MHTYNHTQSCTIMHNHTQSCTITHSHTQSQSVCMRKKKKNVCVRYTYSVTLVHLHVPVDNLDYVGSVKSAHWDNHPWSVSNVVQVQVLLDLILGKPWFQVDLVQTDQEWLSTEILILQQGGQLLLCNGHLLHIVSIDHKYNYISTGSVTGPF